MKPINLLSFVSMLCCFALDGDAKTLSWMENLRKKLPKPPICGSDAQDRIFGETETEINEHPWTVQLVYNRVKILQPKIQDVTTNIGVGSLINEQYVLTAATTVKPPTKIYQLTLSSVRIGEWNIESEIDCSPDDPAFCAPPTKDIKIAEVIVHPDFQIGSKDKHNDIALLRLDTKVEFNDFVKPLCLPLDPLLWMKNYTGHTFEVAGWGKTEKSAESKIKLKLTLPLVSNEECNEIYYPYRRVIDSQICAGGDKGKDACVGDAGAPLMSYNTDDDLPYWVQVGIVLYGATNCGTEGIPGAYTRLSSFMQWIAETIH